VRDGDLLLPLLEEWDRGLVSADPLGFPGYAEALVTAGGESVRTGLVESRGVEAVLIQSDFDVFGGTMGVVAGEKTVRAFRRAVDRRLPVVAVTQTGGARMQEGMAALIQMPRTAGAVAEHSRSGLLSAVIFRSPTTGGVYASWASSLDIKAAEPAATLGFGGPRVVRQVTGEWPPPGSNTAESAYGAGQVDALVERGDQLAWMDAVLGSVDQPLAASGDVRLPGTVVPAAPSSPWQAVLDARAKSRPSGLDWASALCSSWVELRGRDPAIRAGIARILGQRMVIVATDRHADGAGTARPGPAAFRLARRAIGLADRIGLPLLVFVDTPGAEPGPVAESDGIAAEIALTLDAMSHLRTPSISICVGEGGSGGAMALGHADRLYLTGSSIFSVISPEGAAVILHRDAGRAEELAGPLRLTARDLVDMRIADGIMPELAADRVQCLREAVISAIYAAIPGDRDRRLAGATRSFISARLGCSTEM
jgi:acetyl-CoA carboxylase carboxyl transferase subunit beta